MSSWRPSVGQASGYSQSFGGRKQQVWVAKPAGVVAAAPAAANVAKAKAASVASPGNRRGKAQPSTAAAVHAKVQTNSGKRIYKIALLLKVREEVVTPEESPMKSLRMRPLQEESGLRADAPEFQGSAGTEVVGDWSFDYGSWSGLEVPFWAVDDHSVCTPIPEGGVGSKFVAQSPGSTICNTNSEEDVASSATAFSVQNSPAVLPAPAPPRTSAAHLVARESQARDQIEFYFCDNNLSSDWYLRTLMDDNGWVLLTKMLLFPRLARLGLAPKEVAVSLLGSSALEVTWEDSPRVRLRDAEKRAQFPRLAGAVADGVEAAFSWPEGVACDAGAYYGYTGGCLEAGILGGGADFSDVAAAQAGWKPRQKQRRKKEQGSAEGPGRGRMNVEPAA